MKKLCICQSDKAFKQCCDRFLNQGQYAKTPVQLMRSRFSAFALGGYGDYLLATWRSAQSSTTTAAELSIRSTHWLDLEIVDKSQRGNHGIVEFRASYLDKNGERNVHHEISDFERIQGRWFYTSGSVL